MPSPPLSVAVVGGGAAGLVAAIFAAGAGARVTLYESTRQGGKKIVASGGGRCNVLPGAVDVRRFVTDGSPRVLARVLASWPLEAQRAWFERDLGLPLSLEPATGKLFPTSNRAPDVRDALVAAARRAGADLRFNARVTALAPAGDPADATRWRISTADPGSPGPAATADTFDRVVLATGGLSVPATGSDGFGLRAAEALGHRLVPPYPALTPLTASPAVHAALAGVSLRPRLAVGARNDRLATHDGFVFTHRGYSGPAVLDLSHRATLARRAGGHADIRVAWDGRDADAWDAALRAPGAGLVATLVREALPARLADALVAESGVPLSRTRAELTRDERRRLVGHLADYPLPHTGDEGYVKAEVTGGGIPLGDVDPATLESRRAPGLFLAGEVLDAFGPIGGYNFLWAWASGRLAGLGAATNFHREAP